MSHSKDYPDAVNWQLIDDAQDLRRENKNLAVQLSDTLGRLKSCIMALETAEGAFHNLGKPMLADVCKRAIEGK